MNVFKVTSPKIDAMRSMLYRCDGMERMRDGKGKEGERHLKKKDITARNGSVKHFNTNVNTSFEYRKKNGL